MMKSLFDLSFLVLMAILVWIVATGGDMPKIYGVPVDLQRPRYLLTLMMAVLGLRLFFFGGLGQLGRATHVRRRAFASLLYFLLTVLIGKTFISLAAVFYFHRILDAEDWLHTYSTDLSLGFLASIAVLAGALLQELFKNFKPLLVATNILLLFLSATLVGLGILYTLLGYTYFEWGSFLEPQHFEAMRMAGVGPEFFDLFFRWRTLIALAAIAAILYLAISLQRFFDSRSPQGTMSVLFISAALVPALLTASVPVANPRKVAPSVQSPLLLLLRPVSGNMNGVKRGLLRGLETDRFGKKPSAAVHPRYRDLEGVAQGKNVVLFIMESVRRRNVPLYGYERNNMPFLGQLADNAIVFQQAYVMQPRSSKAMAALALGVMPDPRLRPLAWEESRVLGKDSFFNRLIDSGRRFYIGTAQPYGGDNLQLFFNAVANNRADRIISFEDIEADKTLRNDDTGLSRDFLRWMNTSDKGFVGLLWTECAHMPYDTRSAPFGRKFLRDRYDNCLRQVDDALRVLVQGLRSSGKLKETLLVVLGDHGEALGEKFDRGHGNYLYEHSLRIPLLIYNPEALQHRIDVNARFQLKDLSSTLLYLLGERSDINQSVNIFSKGDSDKLYLSNVYQDFKLGVIENHTKFVYRPTYDISYVYDLAADPRENVNIAGRYDKKTLQKLKREVLGWYRYQTEYIERHYPKNGKPALLGVETSRQKVAGG